MKGTVKGVIIDQCPYAWHISWHMLCYSRVLGGGAFLVNQGQITALAWAIFSMIVF